MKKILMVLLAVAVVFSFAACEDDASDPWTIGVRLAKIEDASKPNFAANIEAIDKADAWTFKNNVLTIDITGLKLNDETSIGDLSGTGLESTGAWVCFLFDTDAELKNVKFNNAPLGADNLEPSVTAAVDGSKRKDSEFTQWINLSDSNTYEEGRDVTIYNGIDTVTVKIVVVDNTTPAAPETPEEGGAEQA